VEAKQATAEVVIDFTSSHILTRFGVPLKLVTDNAPTLRSLEMVEFCHDYVLPPTPTKIGRGSHSPNHYPHGPGSSSLPEGSGRESISAGKEWRNME